MPAKVGRGKDLLPAKDSVTGRVEGVLADLRVLPPTDVLIARSLRHLAEAVADLARQIEGG